MLPLNVPVSWIFPSCGVFCSVMVLQWGLHTLVYGPGTCVANHKNFAAVGNPSIVFAFLQSLTFCLPSGKAALGAEEVAAMENVQSHA